MLPKSVKGNYSLLIVKEQLALLTRLIILSTFLSAYVFIGMEKCNRWTCNKILDK